MGYDRPMWVAARRRPHRRGRPGARQMLRVLGGMATYCAVGSTTAPSAAAEPFSRQPSVCLDWTPSIAPRCPSGSWVSSAVESVMGRRVFTGRPCDLVVRGQIERMSGAAGFVVTLSLTGRDGEALGERRLESRDRNCSALGGPASLVIALMVEAGKARVSLTTPPEPTPRETEIDAPSSHAQGTRTLFAAGITASNLLPGLAVGQAFDVGFAPAHFVPFLVGARLYWPTSSERGGRGGSLWAWHAGASICPDLSTSGRTTLALCVGAQAGAVYGTGFGLDYDESAAEPYLQTDAKLVGSLRLFGSLGVFAELGAAVPLLNARFVYLNGDQSREEVFRPAPVLAFGGIGLELRTNSSGEVRGSLP